MRNILVDTGSIVALLHKDDEHHQRVKSFLKQRVCGLLTTWPVMTEAWHLLPAHGRIALTGWALNCGVAVLDWRIALKRLRALGTGHTAGRPQGRMSAPSLSGAVALS